MVRTSPMLDSSVSKTIAIEIANFDLMAKLMLRIR